jgi:hypothetical protein
MITDPDETEDYGGDKPDRESWLQRQFSRMEEAVEDWGLSLPDTFEARFFRGMVVPLAVCALGIYFAVVQKIGLWGTYGRSHRLLGQAPRMVLTGWGVVALGLALVCFGLCLHFHYYWRPRQPRVGAVGMFLSLVLTGVFIIGFIWALVQA